MKALADILDTVAAGMAVLAALFVAASFPTITTGPEFLQIVVFGLLLAIVPYCFAASFARIAQRR